MPFYRSVAQPGRALRSGRRGRGFKSRHSDHQTQSIRNGAFFLYFTSAYKSSNVQLPKLAIFINLRTLEAKNPLFSIPAPWESQTTIPEMKRKSPNLN